MSRDIHAVIVHLIVCLVLSSFSAAAQEKRIKHPVTLEDLAGLKEISTLDISPDGKRIAFTMPDGDIGLSTNQEHSHPSDLGKGFFPLWSPDGKKLAYYSTASGDTQLWVRDFEADHIEQITNFEGGINPDPHTWGSGAHGWIYDSLRYSWSPDGTRLTFASQMASSAQPSITVGVPAVDSAAQTEQAPLILNGDTPPEWTLSGIFRIGGFEPRRWVNGKYSTNVLPGEKLPRSPTLVNQIFIVDLLSKKLTQLTSDDQIYFSPDWSPDGRRIICASFEGRRSFGAGPSNIYAIDVATGAKMPLTSDSRYNRLPRWFPNGKEIGYLTSEKYHYQSMSVIRFPSRTAMAVGATLGHDIEDFGWADDGHSVVLLYRNGVSSSLAKATVDDGAVRPIKMPPAARIGFRTSSSGEAAWIENSGTEFNVIRTLSADESPTAITVVDLNPQIKDWELGQQEIVHWKGSDGAQMEGILIKPVNYQDGQRYPLIVDCYPWLGNGFFGDPMIPLRAWVGKGYMVFQPNPRTPNAWVLPFQTEKIDHEGRGPHGIDVMTKDVLSGVEELSRRGLVNTAHMALYGFSNGGGVVNQLVTRTNRFKCAVSVSGALGPDWSRPFFLHTLDPSMPFFVGATPWDDPNAYLQLSAIFRLDKVSTPMLLAVGDDDGDFLLNQIEMYNGLRWLGKNVSLLRYPGQGHEFTGWALKDLWNRENSFLQECLKQ